MPVVARFEDFDDDLTLPVFHPAGRPDTTPTTMTRNELMDFTLNDEQTAVAEAVEGIFAGLVTPDRVQEIEATEDRFDRELWAELARADLLGLALPEATVAAATAWSSWPLLLEAQGRVGGAGAAVGHPGPRGHADRRVRIGGPAGRAPARRGRRPDRPHRRPGRRGRRLAVGGMGRPSVEPERKAPDGVLLSGTAFAVPYAHVADRVLVPGLRRRRSGRGRARPRACRGDSSSGR